VRVFGRRNVRRWTNDPYSRKNIAFNTQPYGVGKKKLLSRLATEIPDPNLILRCTGQEEIVSSCLPNSSTALGGPNPSPGLILRPFIEKQRGLLYRGPLGRRAWLGQPQDVRSQLVMLRFIQGQFLATTKKNFAVTEAFDAQQIITSKH